MAGSRHAIIEVSGDATMNICLCIISFLGIIGNSLVLYVFFKVPSLRVRHTILLRHQCFIDLISSFLLPLILVVPEYNLASLEEWNPPLAHLICSLWYSKFIFWALIYISMTNLLFITMERYFAVLYPIQYGRKATTRNLILVCALAWMLGPIIEIYTLFTHRIVDGFCTTHWVPHERKKPIGYIVLITTLVIPIAVMLYVYISIIIVLRRSENSLVMFRIRPMIGFPGARFPSYQVLPPTFGSKIDVSLYEIASKKIKPFSSVKKYVGIVHPSCKSIRSAVYLSSLVQQTKAHSSPPFILPTAHLSPMSRIQSGKTKRGKEPVKPSEIHTNSVHLLREVRTHADSIRKSPDVNTPTDELSSADNTLAGIHWSYRDEPTSRVSKPIIPRDRVHFRDCHGDKNKQLSTLEGSLSRVQAIETSGFGCRKKRAPSARRNVLLTIFIICVAYVVCWTPNILLYWHHNVVRGHHWELPIPRLTILLGYFNVCVNPIIYLLKYRSFRKGIAAVFL